MRLQKSSRLAIFALMELASDPGVQVSVSDIGAKYNVSSHHLAKVMHTLGRAGMVRSSRGVGGGYSFCGNEKRITLLDVIMLFENTTEADYALENSAEVTHAEWALRQVVNEIDDIAKATLGAITIATMLKQIERNKRTSKQS